MLEIREVIYQWQKGQRSRAINRSLRAARNTIRDLLRKAQLLGPQEEAEPEEAEEIIERLIKEQYIRDEPGPAQRFLKTHHTKMRHGVFLTIKSTLYPSPGIQSWVEPS